MPTQLSVLLAVALTAGALLSFSSSANAAQQPQRTPQKDAYGMKKAECKREAKAKKFGVHFVQRDRWIKNCIAGHRT
jgi:hypothetical protein